MNEQMILEEILSDIGRNNGLQDFPAKLPFDEANTRLVNYNKASKQKEEKVGEEEEEEGVGVFVVVALSSSPSAGEAGPSRRGVHEPRLRAGTHTHGHAAAGGVLLRRGRRGHDRPPAHLLRTCHQVGHLTETTPPIRTSCDPASLPG